MVSAFYNNGHSTVTASTVPAGNATAGRPGPRQTGPVSADLRFLTANGSSDSHAITLASGEKNRSPRAGHPYGSISWAEIRQRIDAPTAREKDDAPFVILSAYAECDGRTHEVQRERGIFGGLAVDIDTGNPTLSWVAAAVEAVTGGAAAEIYSSSSSTADCRKWRVLIPLAAPITGADYADTQTALFNLLADHGLTCDVALARAAQPVYLPNVPPKRRGSDGQPFFYQSLHVDGPRLDLTPENVIVVARETLRARREAERAAAAARAEAYRERKKAYVEATGDDFDPVAHYNATHTVAEMLADCGFEKAKNRKGNHYKSPLSKSGSFSTEDRGDHWVTVSAWAHDHNVGKTSKNGNRWGDAFDLFVAFKHKGNRRAAIRAYAEELGLARDGLDETTPVVVEKQPDRGPARDLDDWRQEMSVERALAIRMPGLHLDRSPTGSGKTFATSRAIRGAMEKTAIEAQHDDTVKPVRKVLIVLPDHANISERVEEMRADGMDAVAYPPRDETTCGNLEAVRRAEGLGLTAGGAVCWSCPLNDTCLYNLRTKEAERASIPIATHERLRLSPARTSKDADAIVIDETPETVLAPSISVRVDDLNVVIGLASTVRDELLFRRGHVMEPTPEERSFAAALVDAHRLVVEAAKRATEPGVVDIPLPPPAEVPKHWQSTLLRWAVETGVGPGRDRHSQERFKKALRLLTMIVTGKVERLHLLVDQTSRHKRQDDGTVKEWNPLHHFVVGSWKTRLPNVPVLCLDATADADGLRAATGREVRDCTPSGYLPHKAPVVQIPWDVAANQSPRTAAGFVAEILEANPQVQRLGIIGHQRHIRAMMTDDSIFPPRLRARVAKAVYFGQGPDRASNDWHETCDALIEVGTLRPGGGPVRERLVNRGQFEAARRDGKWGVRHWEASTTDGRTIVVEGKGYLDPDWHAAHCSIGRAGNLQGAGRGRSVTDKGIPVWIISDEPMGVPVDDSYNPVSSVVREVVEAVRAIRDGGDGTSLFSIRDTYRKKYGSRVAVKVEAVTEYLRATADKGGKTLSVSGVEKRLRLARKHGKIERVAKGWLAVVGDDPAPADVALPPASTMAVVSRTEPAVVISATPPVSHDEPLEVAAQAPPEVSTAVCTSTAPPVVPPALDDLLMQVEERAAILEYDGGLDSETAARLAHEMVMGRGVVEPLAPAETVGVDHASLSARLHPFVDGAVSRFGGTVRLLEPHDDPFATGWRKRETTRSSSAVCHCGCETWQDVPIHGGRSIRRECTAWGHFIDFPVWYGKRDDDQQGQEKRYTDADVRLADGLVGSGGLWGETAPSPVVPPLGLQSG